MWRKNASKPVYQPSVAVSCSTSWPRVCYYNSARMVCQWYIIDFTSVNLFVVDYQICQNQPLWNQWSTNLTVLTPLEQQTKAPGSILFFFSFFIKYCSSRPRLQRHQRLHNPLPVQWRTGLPDRCSMVSDHTVGTPRPKWLCLFVCYRSRSMRRLTWYTETTNMMLSLGLKTGYSIWFYCEYCERDIKKF